MVLFRDAGHVLGILLIILGASMLVSLPFSYYYADGEHMTIIYSSACTILSGLLLKLLRKRSDLKINKRTGYLVVTIGWIGLAGFSMLPYLFSGAISTVTDSFFETMSGLTTTGASILKDIEIVPPSILFWRSLRNG